MSSHRHQAAAESPTGAKHDCPRRNVQPQEAWVLGAGGRRRREMQPLLRYSARDLTGASLFLAPAGRRWGSRGRCRDVLSRSPRHLPPPQRSSCSRPPQPSSQSLGLPTAQQNSVLVEKWDHFLWPAVGDFSMALGHPGAALPSPSWDDPVQNQSQTQTTVSDFWV